MSAPANRKNVPASHAAVTTGFRCGFCNGFFGKQYLLKAHQHKLHGVPRTTEDGSAQVPRPSPAHVATTTTITTLILPAIQTAAMGVAKARGEIPFAVLHMANEIPLIVRVMEQGPLSVLKAAENADFRESQRGSPVGTSVSIAVVASVYQKFAENGQMYFEIHGPVSRYQATMSSPAEPEVPEGVLQESLGGGDMYKTLTQLNGDQVEYRRARPSASNGPRSTVTKSSSATSVLKRKNPNPNKNAPRFAKQPMTSTPKKSKQPKVIALVDDAKWDQNQNVLPARSRSTVNYQDIATGPLLSPIRRQPVELIHQPTEDPLADLNLLDLVQVDDGLLPDDLGELSGGFL